MNERLRDLADQAGFIRFSPEEDPRTPIDWSSDYEHELKRFAELIVQECAGVALDQKKWVEDQEVFNPQDEQWNRARIQQSQRIADKIKQHFGVEE